MTLTFKNQPKGELIIQKRDSATEQPLPGAEFRVTTAAGCEVGLDGVIGDSTLTQNGIFTTDSAMARSASPIWPPGHTSFLRSAARPAM